MFTEKVMSILIVSSVFFVSCNHSKQKIKEAQIIVTKEEKLQGHFVNKKLESIDTILFDGKKVNESKIILIYTGYDCQSCVDKGYLILKIIRSQNANQKVFIISSNANIGRDQERNEYYDFIYNDKRELLRQELKFVYTPVILVLDKDNCILQINFPETNSNEQKIVEQINQNIF